MIVVRRVTGISMEPSLHDGDIVIAYRKKPTIGDIVIAKVKGREVIKRMTNQSPTALFLQGDNVGASTDSRQYGAVPNTSLLGVVIKTFKR